MGAAALSPDMLTCQNGWNYNGLPPSCNALSRFKGLSGRFLLLAMTAGGKKSV